MTIHLYKNDLPDNFAIKDAALAIDTETMGLNPHRDRLCLVQISWGDDEAHLIQIETGQDKPKNLCALLENPDIEKIFHFARFDLAVLEYSFDVKVAPIFCTKIASKLGRTYTDRHGLRDNVDEIVGIKIDKHQQSSNWGAAELTEAQKNYAAGDVLYLHKLREGLINILEKENRLALAQHCFAFLPIRAALDLSGWADKDIFSHS